MADRRPPGVLLDDDPPADPASLAGARRRAWWGPHPAAVTRRCAAPADRVWEVLEDGWTYAAWVVGASRIRAVTGDWPQPGSLLEHSVGMWPLLADDCTISHGRDGDRLLLEARGQLLGRAMVEFAVLPGPSGCTVAIAEEAMTASARIVPGPLRRAAIAARNREVLRRLVLLAERRSAQVPATAVTG